MHKRFYIKTYGCQMNVYDSDAIAQTLTRAGWHAQASPKEAELIILNSCHIRHKAAEKIYSEVGRLKQLKQQDKQKIIAVAGCVAQAEGKAMIERAPNISLVFGPQHFHQLPQMVRDAQAGKKIVATEFATKEKFAQLKTNHPKQNKVSDFLTIQEGCDKFCSFCVVPYTRGSEISRAPKDIIAETKKRTQNGVKEITLLGQNVNAYHHQGWDLADLLEALADIDALKRIRYTTSHPLDMTTKLICAHRDNPKLMPSLHLPVQSGANKILQKMNRRHTRKQYFDIITELKQACPNIALSSDFIVGFPSENEEDFLQTQDLVEKIKFAQAYSFKYSPRPGTKAADEIQINEDIKSHRLARLQKILDEQQANFHKSKEHKVMEVLMEKNNFGKTIYGQNVSIKNENTNENTNESIRGELVEVNITRATPHGLEGEAQGL